MQLPRFYTWLPVLFGLILGDSALIAAEEPPVSSTRLAEHWRMQSAAVVPDEGRAISQQGYDPKGWYEVSVPSTVLAGLVANGEYPRLFEGDTLRKVPESRFNAAWWYRKTFSLPPASAGSQVWLEFKGINYRADIWLNGKPIASSRETVGTYRRFEFNVTEAARAGAVNVLAVRVFPPDPKKDLAITFVDWAPAPPDRNMGLWQDVEVRTSGPVALGRAFVATDLPLPALAPARVTVETEARNATDRPVSGVLSGRIEGVSFSQRVTLAARESRKVTFAPEAFPQLILEHPRLWWPWQLGKPELYGLDLVFSMDHVASDHAVSDRASVSFGIRHVDSRLRDGHALYSVNGVDVLVLGGGYAPDLLQRRALPGRPDWQEDQIRYVRDMGLNTVRLEGKLEDDAFYDLCDRYGILVMAGWCCCSPWEQWGEWKQEQHTVANDSLRYQIERARNHPSMLVWLNGSDHHPPPDVEREYLAIEKELRWPCPTLSSATGARSEVSGPSGVKMEGPYKWEPPIFWTTDRKTGGAFGFNTEVGPGAVPPPIESLEAMLTKGHLWPIDAMWEFHAGGGSFKSIGDFTDAQDKRYGVSRNASDFSWKAQAQAYETIRAMYEAFRRNKFEATGEIQWMLNNAWPSTIWHLYDYFLRPGGAYFATKVACEPLHLIYGYDNGVISIANETNTAQTGLEAVADVYDLGGKRLYHHEQACVAEADGSARLFAIPAARDLAPAYFLRLTLNGPGHRTLGVNSYWLSTKPDVMGENGGEESWNITPVRSFADLTGLEKLPVVKLTVDRFSVHSVGAEEQGRVEVTNGSAAVAMLVRLKLTRGEGGEEVLPVRWEDNYFMLLPGESRSVGVRYLKSDLGAGRPAVVVDCFNNRDRGESR